MINRVHIIGAGIAGLAAAVKLLRAGVPVTLYESAGHAGGRCRSFYDTVLERTVDNGNHLVLSGNRALLSYLENIGSRDTLTGPAEAVYPFVDVSSGRQWKIAVNRGPFPLWIFNSGRRVPGTGALDYLHAVKMAFCSGNRTVQEVVGSNSALYKNFWDPLTLAVLNTTPETGQAKLLWQVIRRTFLAGGSASIPLVAKKSLGHTFIDPARDFITRAGGVVRFNARLKNIRTEGGRASGLLFSGESVNLEEGDHVILAVPPSGLVRLLSGVHPPDDSASILNIHYRYGRPVPGAVSGKVSFTGIISGTGQWVFVRDDIISVTVSASGQVCARDTGKDDIAKAVWKEVCTALSLGNGNYDCVRVITEKRATPDQSPAGVRRRLKSETGYRNIFLAGDHIDTGLPATIEGAVISGNRAAMLVMDRGSQQGYA